MINRPINPTAAAYAQAHLTIAASRLLFVSGQVPVLPDGSVPAGFDAQCRVVWQNVRAQLEAGGMTLANLVKITMFLSDRAFRADNTRIRKEVLGDLAPAITVIITGIFDEAWLLEIEAVAAD